MEKINIAEILKNAPKGTKLYSPICGECELDCVSIGLDYPISVKTKYTDHSFGKNGLFVNFEKDGECLLFPSKENRDWNTFKIDL